MRSATARLGSVLAAPLLAAAVAASDGTPPPDAVWGDGAREFSIATGSPGETGLLERLATEFAARNDATVHWYRAGSGKALEMLKRGDVDMVLAHAPDAEQDAVAAGWATGRALIGSNEFWIVGPTSDPAGIANAASATEAMRRIADTGSKFVSRGDRSGTHQRELALWERAEIDPEGDWYLVTNEMMTASLERADRERAYFLTDSSTFIVERADLEYLVPLYRGDPVLANPYHTLYPKKATPGQGVAREFGEFLLSKRGQELMRKYGRGRYGEPLYRDAASSMH
ncbi:MAG TPA: substrate-binding domain-containing protein [Steroidobacteraceae bacterium]|nr:substrate-binding domain-containing protein [Steroidobacteraceae bacterium]